MSVHPRQNIKRQTPSQRHKLQLSSGYTLVNRIFTDSDCHSQPAGLGDCLLARAGRESPSSSVTVLCRYTDENW